MAQFFMNCYPKTKTYQRLKITHSYAIDITMQPVSTVQTIVYQYIINSHRMAFIRAKAFRVYCYFVPLLKEAITQLYAVPALNAGVILSLF
jgi:hypothetical protein